MLQALTLILACQLAGELLVLVSGIPVPGPVIGMGLLLGWLFLRGGVSDSLERTTSALLEHLSLLFVPAGVGVMVHWAAIQQEWTALALALFLSTVAGLAATALVMLGMMRLTERRQKSTDG